MFAAQICFMNKCGSALLIPVSMVHLLARHYNSSLSIWLSVDPMSDKYPGVSPYAYYGNNPVRLVDPNGEDIYEFDENGNFIQRISHEYDILRIINIETGDITQSQEYEKGTIFQLETDIGVNTKKTELQSANLFQVNSVESSKSIFEFVANNTCVEWGLVQDAVKEDGSCTNFIGTNRSQHSNTINSIIDNRGYSMYGLAAHNHPNGSLLPSEADIDHAHLLENKHGNIQLKTYTQSNGFVPYNQNSPYVDQNGIRHTGNKYSR